MAQVINIFILILVVSVLSGMTFLFVATLKDNTETITATTSLSIANETGAWIQGAGAANSTGYVVKNASLLGFRAFSVTEVWVNVTDGVGYKLPTSNYTYTSTGTITNNSIIPNETQYAAANISYTAFYISGDDSTAYRAINSTENSGFQITNYLTLLFLALIFGAVLIVVLKIILPYINVGQQIGSGF